MTWSVNQLAARAIALHVPDPGEARDLLEMCGLIAPGGRTVLPDDDRVIPLRNPDAPPGAKDPHGRRGRVAS